MRDKASNYAVHFLSRFFLLRSAYARANVRAYVVKEKN